MTFRSLCNKVKQKQITQICLFPHQLQNSSCVGRVQMFCTEFGAAVQPCNRYAKHLGNCRPWEVHRCCSRGKAMVFACQRNYLTAGVSPLQAAAGILLLAYKNICLKKKKNFAIWHQKPYFNFWVQLFL